MIYRKTIPKLFIVVAILTVGILTFVIMTRETFVLMAREATNHETLDVFPSDHGIVSVRIDHTNEHKIIFTLRNISDMVLYYAEGYIVYRYADGEWQKVILPINADESNMEISQYIEPGIVKNYTIQWTTLREIENFSSLGLDPGRYIFVRHFFTDPNDTENYLTIAFEFDVVDWRAWLEGNDNSDMLEWSQRRRQSSIDFIIEGGASEVIVPVGEIIISQTAIAFSFENRSDEYYIYGLGWELARYIDGQWQPVPFSSDSIGVNDIGITIRGGDIRQENINFAWIFGTLEPGRYMFIRHHTPMGKRGHGFGITVSRSNEYLLMEFIIDENTPYE